MIILPELNRRAKDLHFNPVPLLGVLAVAGAWAAVAYLVGWL